MLRLSKKGQSTAEYAILIGIVIAAVIAMQSWVGRSIKAKIRDAAVNPDLVVTDYPKNLFTTELFEPGTESTIITTRTGGETLSRTQAGGETTRTFDTETTGRTGNVVSPGLTNTVP
ncbi:MAG: hypothetical protein AB1629_01845 [Candidatus Omnitrophota bacterium]